MLISAETTKTDFIPMIPANRLALHCPHAISQKTLVNKTKRVIPMLINYVSGSRADFGLMAQTLAGLAARPDFNLGIVVTGQHLLAQYGTTLDDVRRLGLPIVGEIPVTLSGQSGGEMARALAQELLGFIDLWQHQRPDLVMVLGDRGEMLAATLAAVHLGIHVAHLHGGERSGTLDESFRHAISKLAHFHFAATEDSQRRLISMGENPSHIFVVGAPGLVGLPKFPPRQAGAFAAAHGLDPTARHHALVVFHPVVQEASDAGTQFAAIIDALVKTDAAAVILRPNSDAGGALIDEMIDQQANSTRFRIYDHLPRDEFLLSLAMADVLVGNSSSGIIESASFGTPCLNLGSRQNGRLRNANTVDCPTFSSAAIVEMLQRALALRGPFTNLYGDGETVARIANLLPKLPLTAATLAKSNQY